MIANQRQDAADGVPISFVRWTVAAFAAGLFSSSVIAGPGDLASCTSLTSLQIPNTTITSATYVAPSASLPGYCRVLATTAPQTDVEISLPDGWQGRSR